MMGYGRKGGPGPNQGKRRVRYTATAPDGSSHSKYTFNPPADGDAYMMLYEFRGSWYVAAVVDGAEADDDCWRTYYAAAATREEV